MTILTIRSLLNFPINLPAPVPFDLELDDNPPNGATNPPGQNDNSDTGRSQFVTLGNQTPDDNGLATLGTDGRLSSRPVNGTHNKRVQEYAQR